MKGLNLSFSLVPLDFIYNNSYEAVIDQRQEVKQRKFDFMQFTPCGRHGLDMHSESPILLLFGSW